MKAPESPILGQCMILTHLCLIARQKQWNLCKIKKYIIACQGKVYPADSYLQSDKPHPETHLLEFKESGFQWYAR